MRALIFTTALATASSAWAARPSIQISVDPNRSRNGEPVMLKIQVRAERTMSLPAPEVKLGPEWAVLNRYESANPSVRIDNGDIAYEFRGEYTYLLKPRRAGNLTIPPVTVTTGGKTFASSDISVQVDKVAPAEVAAPASPALAVRRSWRSPRVRARCPAPRGIRAAARRDSGPIWATKKTILTRARMRRPFPTAKLFLCVPNPPRPTFTRAKKLF